MEVPLRKVNNNTSKIVERDDEIQNMLMLSFDVAVGVVVVVDFDMKQFHDGFDI